MVFESPHRTENGAIAQLVEQWTENPCVPGSIPGGTTIKKVKKLKASTLTVFAFFFSQHLISNFPVN